MKIEEIKKILSLKEELDNLSSNIFQYVKDKYLNQLKFYSYSSYGDYNVDEKYLSIEYYDYGYDVYENDYLPDIPIEHLEEEASWKKFLDEYYEKKIMAEKERLAKEEQEKQDKERELYKKLKKKFEK